MSTGTSACSLPSRICTPVARSKNGFKLMKTSDKHSFLSIRLSRWNPIKLQFLAHQNPLYYSTVEVGKANLTGLWKYQHCPQMHTTCCSRPYQISVSIFFRWSSPLIMLWWRFSQARKLLWTDIWNLFSHTPLDWNSTDIELLQIGRLFCFKIRS